MDRIEAHEVFRRTGPQGTLIGAHGEVHEAVPSTMDVARERLLQGVPDGYAVIAEHQTAGRGRDGGWDCPPGLGLLMSIVLQIRLSRSEQSQVTMMGAVAAAEALVSLGVPARIKWPNDVVTVPRAAGGLHVEKLGGVLVERVQVDDAAAPFLMGMGLNVNQDRGDLPAGPRLPATSMRLARGRRFDRTRVCRAVLGELDRWYHRLRMGQPERIMARWRALSCLRNRRVRVSNDGRLLCGIVLGLSSRGELILRADTGQRLVLQEGRSRLVL